MTRCGLSGKPAPLADLQQREEQQMRAVKLAIPSVALLGGFLVCTFSMSGTPEYSKKEKKACTACHGKMSSDKAEMNKNLNATGTCYKDNDHSLAKCETPKK
jgi:hypothetical protein